MQDQLARILTLTQTAKGIWFGYLAALAFTGVTLFDVQDVDFFSTESATQLPVIGVSVPVASFFWGAAFLIGIVYGYLHVFLEKLWRTLGEIDATHGDTPIAEAVHPWLVSDFALGWRRFRTGENTIAYSPLTAMGAIASLILCWFGGPFILGWLWLTSMPAHDALMTGFAGLVFAGSLIAMIVSLRALNRHVAGAGVLGMSGPGIVASLILAQVLAITSLLRTEHDIWGFDSDLPGQAQSVRVRDWLARVRALERSNRLPDRIDNWFRPVRADLAEANIASLPADWTPHDVAKKRFFAAWCKRPDTPACDRDSDGNSLTPDAVLDLMKSDAFTREWTPDRETYLRVQPKPILAARNLSGADLSEAHLAGVDLRGAVLARAYVGNAQLEGADLSGAQMEGASFFAAEMEGANLSGAQMQGADLIRAQMQEADLSFAQMQGADLSWARMEGADLREAQMQGADLSDAQMQEADLRLAQMQGADLIRAQMQEADLSFAQMQEADLSFAQMQEAVLSFAQMQRADLRGARMHGANLGEAQMQGADLRSAQMQGADLRGARMEGADLRFSLLTGTAGDPIELRGTDLSAGTNHGGALRYVSLADAILDQRTDFRNSFADGTVTTHPVVGRPCQWTAPGVVLSDAEFFGRWRGWLKRGGFEESWPDVAPAGFEDVPPIEPEDPACVWAPVDSPLPIGP